MTRVLLLGAALLASVALAAETLTYTVAAGTVTKYRQQNVTDAAFTITDAKASDGSKVPDDLIAALKQSLSKLKTSSTIETTERVLEVQADGTRLVEAQTITQTKVESSVPIPANPPIKFRMISAYKPGGVVEVQDLKYDTTGLNPEVASALEKGANAVKAAATAGSNGLYGVPFEAGKPITLTSNASGVLAGAGLSGSDVTGSEVRTFTGRGAQGQYQFSSTFSVTGNVKGGEGNTGVALAIETASGTGSSSFLPDGRPERSSSSLQQRGTLRLTLPAQSGIDYQISTKYESTTVNSLEIQP